MSSGTSVFFIQKGKSPASGNRNSMPVPSGTRSRNMRPCARVSSSVAISICTVEPSGSTTVGPLYGWCEDAGVCGVVVIGLEQVSANARQSAALFFTLDLDHIVLLLILRDQLVF